MNIHCTLITKPIREMAKALNLSPEVTNNLVSSWQTESGKYIIPSIQILKKYKESKREELNDIALAIPYYTVEQSNSSKELSTSIVKNQDGTMSVVLHTFGEGFNANDLRVWVYSRNITNRNRDLFFNADFSPKAAYYFELYAAKHAIENGRTEITDDDYKEAINLLTKMKQSHPEIFKPKNTGQRIDTTKSEQKTVYDELEEYRGEFESGNPINIPSQQAPSTEPQNSLKLFTNHSGGARGSDSYWGEVGEKYGVTSKHYHAEGEKTPKGNTPVSKEDLQEADEHLKKANETLGRKFPTSNEYSTNLLRRNWQQVKNADAIFAIGHISNNIVDGGTGWAVQMAIDNGKPVHVFDQVTNKWYEYNNGKWVEESTPVLTPNFAGIGTRDINEAGKKAIEEVYKNTYNKEEITSNQTLISKVRDYFLGGETLSEEDAKEFIKFMRSNQKANIAESKGGFELFMKGFTFSTKENLDGALAKTNSNNSITIAKDVTVADFFNYILGNDNTRTSLQKKEVFKELQKAGYTFEALKSLVKTQEDVIKFLLYHEMSHVWNEDRNNYWERDENGNPNRDLMTPHKIGIEARASKDAWNRLYSEKKRAYEEQQHQEEEAAERQGFENRRQAAIKRSIGSEILNPRSPLSTTQSEETKGDNKEEMVENTKEELPEYVLDPNDIPDIGDPIQIEENDARARLTIDFTIGELQLRVDNIARQISETITTLLDELIKQTTQSLGEVTSEDELYRIESTLTILKDPVKGRREVLNENRVGISNIYRAVKAAYEELANTSDEDFIDSYGEEEGLAIKSKYQKIVDNFDALFEDACILVEQFENCRIILEPQTYNDGNTTEKVIGGIVLKSEQEQEQEEQEFGDDPERSRATGNDGWSFKVRFIDPKSTLSSKVRAIISDIIQVDENGNIVQDDLHNTVYVRQDRVYATLLNKLSKYIVDADDFVTIDEDRNIIGFPALEEMAIEYPWVNQIITKLKADPAAVSLFYSNFRQEFINYWMQSNGKTFPLNQPIAREDTLNTIISNYDRGEILDKDSIYNQDLSFNKKHIEKGTKLIDELTQLDINDEDSKDNFFDSLVKAMKMAGIPAKRGSLEVILNNKEGDGYLKLISIANTLKNIFSIVSNLPTGSHLINNNTTLKLYRSIADLVGDVSEVTGSQSFKQGKDVRYSYSAPNFISNMIKNFKFNSKRTRFLQEKYKQYSWFYNKDTNTWNNEWLRLIETDEDVRDMLEVKELISIRKDNRTYEYNQWTPGIIKESFVREYFSLEESEGSSKQFAWYNFPIFADSEVAKFIKFIRYTDNFEEVLLPLMAKVVYQELDRIQLVQKRQQLIKEGKIKEISTFDSKGGKFCFFPQLNDMIIDGKTFLENIIELNDGSSIGNQAIDDLIQEAISNIMRSEFESFMKDADSTIQMLIDEDIASTREGAIDKLREYFWNSTFATSQIIQLTTVDLAFYKDSDDFQKRYKEVYAAGIKLNTNSKYGKKKQNAIYLVDDVVTSASYSSIQSGLDQAVEEKRILDIDRDNILYKFRDITATDAQAFRTLPSFRSVLDMLGLWTEEMETVIKHFEDGEWDMSDFNVIWQTIKPFIFSILDKPDGLGGRMPVPHQNKNSEFLLLAAYQLVGGVVTKSPVIRGLNRAMLDNNIDVAEYQSAVKVGCQGAIDITYSRDKINKAVKDRKVVLNKGKENEKSYSIPEEITEFRTGDTDSKGIKEYFDDLLHNKRISQEEYNDIMNYFRPSEEEVYNIITDAVRKGEYLIDDGNGGKYNEEVVHQSSYEDYVVQQPTPEHLFDTVAVFGSQFRNLIISDMDDNIEITIGSGKDAITLKGREAVQSMYQNLIVENLLEDYEKVSGKFVNIHTLQKALMDTVRGNPKYGRDMIDALKIVKHIVNGVEVETFNIPLHSPTITNKVQELVNAMFKNAVTKQTINGGNCILVSNVGYTDKLSIVYDKNNKLVGAECYMPFYTKKYFQPFLKDVRNSNGEVIGQEVDIEAIRKSDPELLKMIGYRIPTENKYSMLPLIIKGFLPQQNGSAIMLPADVTQLAGSDFDKHQC